MWTHSAAPISFGGHWLLVATATSASLCIHPNLIGVFLVRPNDRLTFPPKGKFRLYASVAQPVALIHTGPGRLEYDTANSNVAELNLDAPVRGRAGFDTGFLTLSIQAF
jgi:hypothetical protein